MKQPIVPSIIAQSQKELDERVKKVSFAKLMQLDVMDGSFVKHTSLEFDFKLPKKRFEAHLMLKNPHGWYMNHKNKISSVIVHYESDMHMHDFIKLAKKHKKEIGIALNPKSEAEDIAQYLHLIDKVLIMTVNPGKYGSKFLPDMLDKIKEIRKLSKTIDIEVDGGINPRTAKICKKAGANQFVIGSYLQKAKNPRAAWKKLEKSLV